MAATPGGPTPAYPTGLATEGVVVDERRPLLLNRVSWGAVFAGLAVSLVVQLLLGILGVGVGASSLDATRTADNPTVAGFSISAAVWWTVSGIIASFLGGLVAGRLCGTVSTSTARWHGLVSWAATTLVVFWLLTSAVGGLLGGTLNALGSTLGGLGKAAASAVSGAAGAAQNADGNAIEARVRQLVNPNDTQSLQDNVAAYLRASVAGDQQAADAARDRAVDSLARAANISPDEARSRLDQATQQVRQTVQQAKDQAARAADAARQGLASASIYGFVALVLGAIAAWIGGGVGTPSLRRV